MLKKPTFIGVSIIGFILIVVLLVNVFVYAGMKELFPTASVTGHYSATEKKERDSAIPVKKVSASADVPAQQAVNSIMKKDVSSLSGWDGGEPNSGTPASVFSWVCGKIKGKNIPYPSIANSKSYTKSGRKNFTTVVAYAYGAGEGRVAVDKLQEQASSCSGSAGLSSGASPTQDSNGGFSAYYLSSGKTIFVNTWAVGDVVLSISSTSRAQANSVSSEYNDYTRGLIEPMCLSLVSKDSDVTRNPYISGKSYTGWNKGRKVDLNKDAAGINPGFINPEQAVSGKGYTLGSLPGENNAPTLDSIPGDEISYDTVILPQEPLKPFPDILPDPVKKPLDAPKAPKVPEESMTVAERVKDDKGPGCGWAFTSQSSPVFDDTAEKKAADEREVKAQDKMQTNQISYYGQVADYVEAYEKYAISVEEYKDYYEKVEKVRTKWQDITDKRDDYRRKLDQYYADLKNREDFFDRQKKAEEQYKQDTEACKAYKEDMADYNDKVDKDRDRYDREVAEWRKKKQDEADKKWEEDQKDSDSDSDSDSSNDKDKDGDKKGDKDGSKDGNKDGKDSDSDSNKDGTDSDDGKNKDDEVKKIEPHMPTPHMPSSGPKDYSNVTPPSDEVTPPGQGIDKPTPDNGASCPATKPAIIDQAPPYKPSPPKKPDVELPDAWNDIPDEG